MPPTKKREPAVSPGQSSVPGQPHTPSGPPEDDDEEKREPTHIPIGIPVSPEEYERLKKEANTPKRTSSPTAQQDPAEKLNDE